MLADGLGSTLDEALKVLEKLKLSTCDEAGCSYARDNSNSVQDRKNSEEKEEEELLIIEKKFRRSRSFSSRNRRFAPYRTPAKRSSSCGSKESEIGSESASKISSNASNSKEVLIHSGRNATTCTQEALGIGKCTDSGESLNELRQDAAVDELSEYFAHFVGVQSKMSPLAESMYA